MAKPPSSWWGDPGGILAEFRLCGNLFFLCLSPIPNAPALSAAAVFCCSPGVLL